MKLVTEFVFSCRLRQCLFLVKLQTFTVNGSERVCDAVCFYKVLTFSINRSDKICASGHYYKLQWPSCCGDSQSVSFDKYCSSSIGKASYKSIASSKLILSLFSGLVLNLLTAYCVSEWRVLKTEYNKTNLTWRNIRKEFQNPPVTKINSLLSSSK